MANHTHKPTRYIVSKSWDEVMGHTPPKGEAEAYFFEGMVDATSHDTAYHGEASMNGGGAEPFHYTVEGRQGAERPPARKYGENDYEGEEYAGKPTKTMIAHMPRASLLEWMPGATGTVAELRSQLRAELYPGG